MTDAKQVGHLTSRTFLIASQSSVLAAYTGLFAWSFLAATILPLASEPALVVLVRRGEPLWMLLIVATSGNTCGACRVPLLGDAIVATAGAASMKFAGFFSSTLIGKAARYAAVAYLASKSSS